MSDVGRTIDGGAGSDYESLLAPYAARGSNSHGRAYDEPEHPYRSPFQRDRDRIIHSKAFRRLESKTQVYTNLYQEGDFFRKRLTHSLEVAQIAKSAARALRLNEDLVEAIALAHDIGHPPFGHKGQDILHDLMKASGGFEHNTQALRIVSVIETRYPGFPGLNLTYEVREGILKKRNRQREPLKDVFAKFPNPTLEAQIVNIADPIAYSTHDLDDGIAAGTIGGEILKKCGLWNEAVESIAREHPGLPEKILKYQAVRYLINAQVTDLVNTTRANIEKHAPESIEDVRKFSEKLAGFSPAMKAKHDALKSFLRENMYEHSSVKRMEHRVRILLENLFDAYLKDPSLLPESVRRHYDKEKKKGNEKRIVCDYIAGMTDRFALDRYQELFDPSASARR
jgi:dGTPase